MLRRIGAFVVAAAVMVLLGSAAHSYFVQRAWSIAAGQAARAAPAAIPIADRISWAAHDLIGMIVPYSALTSVALLIAFLIAGALARLGGFRVTVFGAAGALALFTLFTVLRPWWGTVRYFRRARNDGPRGTDGGRVACGGAVREAHRAAQTRPRCRARVVDLLACGEDIVEACGYGRIAFEVRVAQPS